MTDTLTTAERVAIDHLVCAFGPGWVDPALDEIHGMVEDVRAKGLDDDAVQEELLGRFHDKFRPKSELMYLAARGLLRLVIHATARDGVEAR